MNELINEQINLILEDLTLISNPYERSMVRVNLVKALSDMNLAEIDEPPGKDAIKSDYAKKQETTVDTTEETTENEYLVEENNIEDTTVEDITEEKLEPKEIDIDHSVVETTPVITTMEDEEGNTFELDITEAYNKLNRELPEEERIEIARNITAYSLMPIYDELNNLEDKEDKMLLAYYLQQLGVDELNNFVSELTDGTFSSVFEFVNDDNLSYLIAEINEAIQE